MEFIAEGLRGAAGGGAVTVVVRDACPVLTIVEMGGDTMEPCLGSEAEKVLHNRCAASEVGCWLVQGPSEELLQVKADIRPPTACF